MKLFLPLTVVLCLLCACAGSRVAEVTPATPTPPETAAPTNTPPPPTTTAAPTATATATATPTATPIPTETATPSPVPTVDPATLSDLQRGYIALVMLESTVAGIDELARKLQAGEVDSFTAGLTLLVLSSILGEVKKLLDQDPPVRSLSSAWTAAREAMDELAPILADWFDKKTTSVEVVNLLPPVMEHFKRAVDLADRQIAREYSVSRADLDKLREEAKANFRAMVEGTPTPTARPG